MSQRDGTVFAQVRSSMRLVTWNDTSLVVGLIAGTAVIFQRPLRFVLQIAGEVQDRYQVDLLPALTIFVGVLIFHEARKRQQAKAEARAAAAEAAQARLRSEELERLMTFSQALAGALNPVTLEKVLWRHLPAFVGDREFWVLARRQERWEMLLRTTALMATRAVDLDAAADRVVAAEAPPETKSLGQLEDGLLCFPMIAGSTVSVLGIHDGASITDDQRKTLGVITGLIAIAVRNVELFLQTQEHGLRDSLTSCLNRGYGLEILERELDLANRSRRPLSILMFDIDHFKTINDQLGHLRGDDLLRAVGAHLTRVLRNTDVKCRYGGDEFLIVLPDTPAAGARQIAESLRQRMSSLVIVSCGKTVAVTVSVGIATAGPAEPGITGLIDRADTALYRAKRDGRNRCHAAGVPIQAVKAVNA